MTPKRHSSSNGSRGRLHERVAHNRKLLSTMSFEQQRTYTNTCKHTRKSTPKTQEKRTQTHTTNYCARPFMKSEAASLTTTFNTKDSLLILYVYFPGHILHEIDVRPHQSASFSSICLIDVTVFRVRIFAVAKFV